MNRNAPITIGRVQPQELGERRGVAVDRPARRREEDRLKATFARAKEMLDCGESAMARDELRALTPADFGEESRRAEGLLALLRDRRATDQEIRLILVVAQRLVE